MRDEGPTFPDPEWQRHLFEWLLSDADRQRFTLQGVLWALEVLDPYEEEIVLLRFGKFGPRLSQQYVAIGLGISLRRVLDRESSARKKMLACLRDDPFSWK